MLSTHIDSAIQTDILPTQNIGPLDHNQPQIFSILTPSNSPSSVEEHRRKKTTKLEGTIPVMINPPITRIPTDVAFVAPQHCSTTLPDSITSFVSTGLMNDHAVPLRFYIGRNSYDANNNIDHNQISLSSMALNSSLTSQTQQNTSWLANSLPGVNVNSMPQMVVKPQVFGINHLLNNNGSERAVSVPFTQQNEYKHLNSSFTSMDQGNLLNHFHPFPSALSSTSVSKSLTTKPKRKYSKKVHVSAPAEQQPTQRISQSPTVFTQPIAANGLPSIIPASITVTPIKSGEHPFLMDVSTTSNFKPLTPPASISSIRSPPTNINNESSLIPVQQHLLPLTTTNITELNSRSRQYFHDHGFFHTQKTTDGSSTSNLSYNFHALLASARHSSCLIPSNLISTNILPMTYSSTLSGNTAANHLVSISDDTKKERKKRGKGAPKIKVVQSSIRQIQTDEQLSTSKTRTIDISATTKKRKRKSSNTKDIQTKKRLRRLVRRKQLAVLKFIMRKRKQQKLERVSIAKSPEVKAEQVVPKLVSTHMIKPNNMEINLPDIIATNLKISFDAAQNIESISVYYHQRRKPDIINGTSSKSTLNTDNKLGLLIEAVEFIETLQESSKLALSSVG